MSLYGDGGGYDRRLFKVAIVCALEEESTAVEATFDEFYDATLYGKVVGDANAYRLGRIDRHAVVLVYLPSIGKASSASAAVGLRTSFVNIELCLLVGICGGVPFYCDKNGAHEIMLGDVVIGTGVIQHDFGRQFDYGRFVRKNTIYDESSRLSSEVRSLVHKNRAGVGRRDMQDKVSRNVNNICQRPDFVAWQRPPRNSDILHAADYIHKHRKPFECEACDTIGDSTCSDARQATCDVLVCDRKQGVPRLRQDHEDGDDSAEADVQLHWGLIASGDSVMKSGRMRDNIAITENVVAFEMEGAGLWDTFSTLIVKGVCDYADSHKNKAWQRFAAVAAAATAKALLSSHSMSASSAGHADTVWHQSHIIQSPRSSVALTRDSQRSFMAAPDPAWLVPFDHRDEFVGRCEEVSLLSKLIVQAHTYTKAAISGLGGMGKSRLALEIAYETVKSRPECSVFWVQCSDLSTFERDYRKIALHLELPSASDMIKDPKLSVKEHLEEQSERRWLLILDSADNEILWLPAVEKRSVLLDYIPRSRFGTVLVTTRTHRIAVNFASKNVVKLSHLSLENSQSMMRSLLERPELISDTRSTKQLLEHLTHLPLAVVQAAAFINQNSLYSIDDYLEIWNSGVEDEIIEILNEEFTDDSRYGEAENPVGKTWLISFRHISMQRPLAATLLSYMGCLNHKNILKSSIPPLKASRLELDKAFGTLQNYAFIQLEHTESSDTTFNMHRLVHLATRNYFRRLSTFPSQLETVAKHLCGLLPRSGLNSSVYWHQYLPHAEKVVSLTGVADDGARSELQELLSSALHQIGAYAQSLGYRKALVDELEDRNAVTVTLLTNMSALSDTLRKIGRWKDALEVSTRASGLSDLVLEADDPARLTIMVALASACRFQGAAGYDQALNLNLKAVDLAKYCSVNDDDERNLCLLTSMKGLAQTYFHLRRYQEQETQLLEAIEISKHLTTFDRSIHSAELEIGLASASTRLRKADLAERRLLPASQLLQRQLGRLHRLTLSSLSALAEVYSFQLRFYDAEMQYREVLERFVEVGRDNDYDVLATKDRLAYMMFCQNRFEEAKSLSIENVGIATRILGKDNIATVHTLQGLAWTYWRLGNGLLAVRILRNCATRAKTPLSPQSQYIMKRWRSKDANEMHEVFGPRRRRQVITEDF